MARKGMFGSARRAGLKTVRLALTIPATLRERLEKEAPLANWSAVVTQMITELLDRNQHVHEALSVRLARLETEFAEHVRGCKGQ